MNTVLQALVYITYLGTASFVLEGDGARMMTDPGDFLTARFAVEKAGGMHGIDIVIVTHADFDHTNRLLDIPGTGSLPVVGTRSVKAAFPGLRVVTDDEYSASGFEIRRMRSIHGLRHDVDHSSYLIRVRGITLLFLGDAYKLIDTIDEHVDVMFVTIGGFEATPENAVKLVSGIQPDIVIPMHWEVFFRSAEPAIRFRGLLEKTGMKVQCVIPEIDKTITVGKENGALTIVK
jgi:L-ascorbate metabolism protein UlaG (beta-lactamase superfamily)